MFASGSIICFPYRLQIDPSIVPRNGVGDYDDLDGTNGKRNNGGDGKGDGQNEGGTKLAVECRDIAPNCFRFCRIWQKICHRKNRAKLPNPRPISLIHLCDNSLYRTLMNRQCAKSCQRCNVEGGGGEHQDGGNNNGLTIIDEGGGECARRDHESCHTWANNGFCHSKSYSLQIKRQICPHECQFC